MKMSLHEPEGRKDTHTGRQRGTSFVKRRSVLVLKCFEVSKRKLMGFLMDFGHKQ